MDGAGEVVTEVPSSLKRLVRMVMRGFYNVEHTLLVDMLIRHPCMKEDDLVELLKFERKQLRAIVAQLKNDRFVKVRLRMETGADGKATRQNYYYVNYKVFVNVVKYKLDHMRRKIETEERDSTSRASFRCTECEKTFTDLEADQLCDFTTGEFRCTFCSAPVEEDQSALPKKDSRLLLARFNDQIEPLYALLREVEDIKLAPELLEPEPTDVTQIKKDAAVPGNKPRNPRPPGEHIGWSGEATANRDYNLITEDVTITFGDERAQAGQQNVERKERPVWMVKSTVLESSQFADQTSEEARAIHAAAAASRSTEAVDATAVSMPAQNDIMEALLAHEKKSSDGGAAIVVPGQGSGEESDTSESDDEAKKSAAATIIETEAVEMESEEEEEDVPTVAVGDERVPLQAVTEEHVSRMTPAQKEAYIKLSQELYAHMYE